jgi:hypothetical protein
MTDALIWILALGGVIAVAIVVLVLGWAVVQEFSNDK